MLQGLATSVLKGEGDAACTPDAPRATKPTEATIFFIVSLSCSHPKEQLRLSQLPPFLPKTRRPCQNKSSCAFPQAPKSIRPLLSFLWQIFSNCAQNRCFSPADAANCHRARKG